MAKEKQIEPTIITHGKINGEPLIYCCINGEDVNKIKSLGQKFYSGELVYDHLCKNPFGEIIITDEACFKNTIYKFNLEENTLLREGLLVPVRDRFQDGIIDYFLTIVKDKTQEEIFEIINDKDDRERCEKRNYLINFFNNLFYASSCPRNDLKYVDSLDARIARMNLNKIDFTKEF